MIKHIIGIDVSKANLDAACLPGGQFRQFSNDSHGRKALWQWIEQTGTELVVFEASGACHRQLERFLDARGQGYAKVNPRRARAFAKAAGKLAKTDRADAMVLARMGVALQPSRTSAKTASVQMLGELVLARRALVKDKTAVKNRLHTLRQPLLERLAKRRLKQVLADIAIIDQACRDIIASDRELSRRMDILISIPGLGEVTACAILAEMPELGTLDKRQAASLAGLAPVIRQSGTWRGRSFIQGGRKPLRDALYMPALIAARCNPQLKAVYQRMRDAGKPAKVAITAIMRRLIVFANATIRDNRKWNHQTT